MDNEDLRKIPTGVLFLDEVINRPPFRLSPEQLEEFLEAIKKSLQKREEQRRDNQ